MEGDFTDADVDSDDIAYFAPELKEWKKHIRITGDIKGTVSDLQGRHVILEAGKNTRAQRGHTSERAARYKENLDRIQVQ